MPLEHYEKWEEALKDADLAVIQSDWNEIRDIKADDFKRLLDKPYVFDGRRSYDPVEMVLKGVKYYGIRWKNQN